MKYIKKYISYILTIVVLLLFGIYLFKNPQIITELKQVNILYVFLILLIQLSIFYIEGLFILVTLKIFNKEISKGESFYLATISRIGNYLLPMRAGAVFRATYLKKKYDFNYSNFLSTLYGYYIIFFLTNALLGLMVILLKGIITSNFDLLLIIFFVGIILGMVFLIFVRIPFKKIYKKESGIINKIITFLEKFILGWDLIVKDKKSFILLLLLAFANVFLSIWVVYFEFLSIGKVIFFLDIILYTCLSGVSLLISITPGSLGIREAVFLTSSNSLGLSEQEIMKLAFLDRGIMFVLLLICLIAITFVFKEFNFKKVFFEKGKSK